MNSVLHKELLTCMKRNCRFDFLYWTADQGDPILCCLITVLCIGLLSTTVLPDKEICLTKAISSWSSTKWMCSLKKIDLDVNSGPDSCGQWKSICTSYDMSRAELLKCPGELIVASGAEQTLTGRRREPCKDWPTIAIYIWSLFLFLNIFILHWPFLFSWANNTALYQEDWAVPRDELTHWPSGAELKSFCPHPYSYKCPALPSSGVSRNCIVQF